MINNKNFYNTFIHKYVSIFSDLTISEFDFSYNINVQIDVNRDSCIARDWVPTFH